MVFDMLGELKRKNYEELLYCLNQAKKYLTEEKLVFDFFIAWVSDNKDKAKEILNKAFSKRTVTDSTKSLLLWYAFESGFVRDDVINALLPYLKPDSMYGLFHQILRTTDKNSPILNNVSKSHSLLTLEKYQLEAIGEKLFSLNRLGDAAAIWKASGSYYYLAMLRWKHGPLPPDLSVDIEKALIQEAENGHVDAQCALIHWLLAQKEKPEFILNLRAVRYVNTPNILSTFQRMFYQGITLYTAHDCNEDNRAEARKKVRVALEGDPLVVAVKIHELVKLGVYRCEEGIDYLLAFSNALLAWQTSASTTGAGIFYDLLLNVGEQNLEELIGTLRSGDDTSPERHATLLQASEILRTWFDLWKAGKTSAELSHKKVELEVGSQAHIEAITNEAILKGYDRETRERITHLVDVLKRKSVKANVQDLLCTLLANMPIESAEHADQAEAILALINKWEYREPVLNSFLQTFTCSFALQHEEILRNLLCRHLPSDFPVTPANEADIQQFLAWAVNEKKWPASISLLLKLSYEEQSALLIRGLPELKRNYPNLYTNYLSNAPAHDIGLISQLWPTLVGDDNNDLIALTFKALIDHDPSIVQNLSLSHPLLTSIDKFKLFQQLSVSGRYHVIDCGVPDELIQALIEERKIHPGITIPDQHIDSNIRRFLTGEKAYSMMTLLGLVLTVETKPLDDELRQAFRKKVRHMATQAMELPIKAREEQDTRIAAAAILHQIPQ